jgi:hypothetical protein
MEVNRQMGEMVVFDISMFGRLFLIHHILLINIDNNV